MSIINCTVLSSRTDFATYTELLRNATSNDFSRVADCRLQVCGALWGTGNPDISGIGMVVGYLLESIIACSLLCVFTWLKHRPPQQPELPRLLLATASRMFYDNATLFTFAIQTASIVTLTRVDFGISASGMGAVTMEIAWLVSTLTLLPLLPLVLQPQLYRDDFALSSDVSASAEASSAIDEGSGRVKNRPCSMEESTTTIAEARQDLRFLSFVICWAMAFCPFFSRMSGTFGTSFTPLAT
jgi:hypothetical protein